MTKDPSKIISEKLLRDDGSESRDSTQSYYNGFPDVESMFSWNPGKIDDKIDEAIVVLDTNTLLIPYTTNAKSLSDIGEVLKKLVSVDRLRVPGHVVREFAKNRPTKLSELYHQLNLKLNINLSTTNYPLLSESLAYKSLVEVEEKLTLLIKEYRKHIDDLKLEVRNWNYQDPVSLLYSSFLTKEIIIEIEETLNFEDLEKEYKQRLAHRLPPGYKDAAKEENALGDFLIWKTILKLGREKKPLIFVTGDEKSDWWVKSSGQTLYSRYELIDEYRRHSDGNSFFIITFAEFLQKFSVPLSTVEDVKVQEKKEMRHVEGIVFDDALRRTQMAELPLISPNTKTIDFLKLFKRDTEAVRLGDIEATLVEARANAISRSLQAYVMNVYKAATAYFAENYMTTVLPSSDCSNGFEAGAYTVQPLSFVQKGAVINGPDNLRVIIVSTSGQVISYPD